MHLPVSDTTLGVYQARAADLMLAMVAADIWVGKRM